jgi:hypothetical protein
MKKNGYNSDTANVLCSRPPETALTQMITRELSASGFQVLGNPSQAGPSAIVLTGRLEKFFVEPKSDFFFATWETDIGLHLWANTASGLAAEREFYVKGEEATVLSELDAKRSLDSAVRQLVASVVGAVANLADSLPSAPRPVATTIGRKGTR